MGRYMIKIGLLGNAIKTIAIKTNYTELFELSYCSLNHLIHTGFTENF